jgi:NADPH:quinone reductase-like Zn-dependent oxidoreductase
MRLRYKILSAAVLLIAVATVAGALTLSHTSPCQAAPPLPAGTATMKAAVHRCYGSPDVVALEDVSKPTPAANEVLVRIHAASVNALDWHVLRGEPYIMRMDGGLGVPDAVQLGRDFAGTVEAVGKDVTRFKPGDEVFGSTSRGSFAEYVSVGENWGIAPKPANLTFEEAAALPVAALTALQALRDQGHVRAGQKVLVNGASGGVGTFTVQIAKALGAEVTGVCSTRNVAMVRALGADRVIDYTREDVLRGEQRYDVIIDNVGNHSLLEFRRIMQPSGILVIVGAGGPGKWIAPFVSPIKAMMLSPFVNQHGSMFFADITRQDLAVVADLSQASKVKSIIDRRYALPDVANAIRYVEDGHARAKVVVTVP